MRYNGKGRIMRKQCGFSLVELSIVLIILGLLTGGILGGQSLIAAAEMRSIGTELQAWQTAVNSFRQKYQQYPGDFNMATRFWGADAACPAGGGDVLTQTCNGDGNGQIASHGDTTEYPEAYLFWQHLALAGLINGEYTGAPGPDHVWHHQFGTNAPTSKFSGGAWAMETDGDHGDIHYNTDARNAFTFGSAASGEVTYTPILTPQDAWNIDTKFDDGKPGRGSVIVINYDECAGAADADDVDTDYVLNESAAACSLYFRYSI
jgi:prepilin-type N-terminal cleavage/methylation domain-containing protein